MLSYIARRFVLALVTIWAISVLSFVIIQLPPGDYVTAYTAQMSSTGTIVTRQEVEALRIQFGLDKPIHVQYIKWMGQIARGNFGMAMEYGRPVLEVIGDRLWLTVAVSLAAVVFTWVVALPIGIYSAVRQYSLGDYVFTFIGFIGVAIPSFLLALIVMYLGFKYFNANVGGLFSAKYQLEPWSIDKVLDLLKHLPLPAIVLGLAGTAQLVRIMRANLLDEVRKPYVVTARAKGLSETQGYHEVPGSSRAQSLRQHHRLSLPLHRVGQHHRLPGAEPADGGTAAAQGAAGPGHVSGRDDHAHAGRFDRHRHFHFGPAVDVD